jgi:hypothetical protein
MRSASYKESKCCKSDCDYESDLENEPCWGEVQVVGEQGGQEEGDWNWVHACEGHNETIDGGKYILENVI